MAQAEVEIRSSGSALPARRPGSGRKPGGEAADTRFDRQLAKVLEHAAQIFCEKGYEGASMRDLSRAAGMSLAGLYHYFESKEELLYLIQKHTFRTIIERAQKRLEGATNPEERIRIFIENHVEYFLANKEAMRVLTHEDDTLKDARGAEVRAIKREYYRICLELLEDLRRTKGLQFSGRLAVLGLFGMINWIYTWHNPRVDADATALAEELGDLFLRGVLNPGPPPNQVLARRGESPGKPRRRNGKESA
jgi:AcrR family transcriptional regulator